MNVPRNLTRWSSRHPWLVVGIWLAAIVVSVGLISRLLAGAVTAEDRFLNNPESDQAKTLIEQRLTGPEKVNDLVIVDSTGATVDEAGYENHVRALQRAIQGLGPGVIAGTTTYYQDRDPSLVSADRRTTLIPITFAGNHQTAQDNIPAVRAALDGQAAGGYQTLIYGQDSVNWEFAQIAGQDMAKGEAIGVMAALVILLAVFGAVIAGVIPLLMGLASIVIAMGMVALVGQLFPLSYFVENMVAMMGLALGIDYSLFIISRYREERGRGREKLDAIATVGGTAGRAVTISGSTVVLALIGMLIVPFTIFRSLAAGAIFVAIASVLASLTLLPALLSLLGDRVNALRVLRRRRSRPAGARGGVWDRISGAVMGHPVIGVVGTSSLLVAAAIPLFSINLGFPGVSTLPEGIDSQRAYTLMVKQFSGGLGSPVQIAVDGDIRSAPMRAAIAQLRAAMDRDGAFGSLGSSTEEVNTAGNLAVVTVPMAGDPDSDASVKALERLRGEYVPAAFAGTGATVLVGGNTAMDKDFFDVVDAYMPITLAVVLGVSFLLLTTVFRSVVVALEAIVMNLLSVGAVYGLLVLVTQKGIGAGLLGVQQVDVITAWLPLFLFSILFGLSMDYHVFLLSRIREHYDRTGDNAESVAYALRTTGGIITGAALIMVAVFAGFASGRLVPFQQMGFGFAAAVFIDATLVRCVLVPASMKLLGRWNWYLPRWLEWLPTLRVEEAAPAEPTAMPAWAEGAEPVREPAGTAGSRH